MNQSTLRKHQLMLLSMLKEIDRICKKHGIGYMLFAGTALGAVRHQGFIPWDDDLDVIMLREDYEKFLAVAAEEIDGETYYLQKEFSDHWPMYFSKLRKNGTACMEKYPPKDRELHQGIYVDIFPCDLLSERKAVGKLQFLSSRVVVAKSLSRRGYLTDSLKKKAFMGLCRLLPLGPFLRFAKGKKYKNSKNVQVFLAATSKYEKSVYPREWFTRTRPMAFEDGEFPVSAHYDSLLTAMYGDYMTLPSEEERQCKAHAMKIDLENSYERYIDWQLEQKVDVYLRSIR